MSGKLKAGIIGCGSIYGNHAGALSVSEYAELAAVCDNKPDALAKAAAKWCCAGYGDYKAMLKDAGLDSVHICAPHYLHAEMAIAAMRSGKHVFCEKPAAIRSRDVIEMARVSEETGMKLAVCFQNRFNDTSVMMKEILDSGRAGPVIGAKASVTWRRRPKYYTESDWRGKWATEGGGVLINQAIHTLDLLQWLLGPVESLKAHTDRYTLAEFIEVEDTADAFLKFKSGAQALFYATNSYVANSPVELEIVCEKAVMKLADTLTVKFDDGAVIESDDSIDRTDEKSYYGNSHQRLIELFYKCVAEGAPSPLDAMQAVNSVRLIEAIYESAKTGGFATAGGGITA